MLFRNITFAAIAALACLFLANDAMAQRGGWGGGGRLELLNNRDVQKELDLVDDQLEDIEDMMSAQRDVMRNAFSGMREKFQGVSREERDELMASIRSTIQEKMKEVDEKVSGVLVPHQLARLDQLVFQNSMRRGGATAAFENAAVRDKLKLTDEEIVKLKEKEEEVKKDLEEKIKKLRAEAQDEILSVLSAEKQASVKEMIGESFEMTGGRGDRGRGRRGGDRGRGGDRERAGDRGVRGGGS